MKTIEKKKIVVAVLNKDNKSFVIYIASFADSVVVFTISIYLFQVYLVLLLANETLVAVFKEYVEYATVFSLISATWLPKYIGINDYPVYLEPVLLFNLLVQ